MRRAAGDQVVQGIAMILVQQALPRHRKQLCSLGASTRAHTATAGRSPECPLRMPVPPRRPDRRAHISKPGPMKAISASTWRISGQSCWKADLAVGDVSGGLQRPSWLSNTAGHPRSPLTRPTPLRTCPPARCAVSSLWNGAAPVAGAPQKAARVGVGHGRGRPHVGRFHHRAPYITNMWSGVLQGHAQVVRRSG